MKMRLLLIAPFESIDAREDAQLLKMRGYDAVTYGHLYHPKYTYNCGSMATERLAWHNVCTEMLYGTLAVIHPDAKPAQIAEVASLCRAMKVHLVHLQDLPACPPENTEVLDAANCVADPFRLAEVHPAHVAQMAMGLHDEDNVTVVMAADVNARLYERAEASAAAPGRLERWGQLVRRMGRAVLSLLASKNPMSGRVAATPKPRPYPLPGDVVSATG